MAIVLLRVDERLIHGQVVIGWGHQLRPDRFVLVDDELAESEWEQELYALGVGSTPVEFVTVDEAQQHLGEWRASGERVIALTRDVPTMRRLAEGGGLMGQEVNLGGIHHAPGREEVLPYLHLGPADREDLRRIADAGAEVSARDLPDTARVDLASLLKE